MVERPQFAESLPQFNNIKEVLVAGNRGPCGGVNMAIEAANQVLDIVDKREPVYTNWDLVNNNPVMDRLKTRGLINVRNNWELVPDNSIVFFSAHGVPPKYHEIATTKNFLTIDVTCQLVTRVHTLVKNAKAEGAHVVYIGKSGHPETIGVLGELEPQNTTFIEPDSDISNLKLPTERKIIVYSQTTLATDEVKDAQTKLKQKFPEIIIPNRFDICYATDNRQTAVDNLLDNYSADFLLVAGSAHSHNSQELKRKADRKGIPSALIDNPNDLRPELFTEKIKRVGVTSGASEMEEDFQKILDVFRFSGIDPIVYVPQVIPERDMTFKLPQRDIDLLKLRYKMTT